MEAKLYGQSKSGLSVNGIIKDYYAYAGENIKAGDLVEFINGVAGEVDYGESVATQLSTETNSGYAISAVQLDDNKVFIAHNYGSSYYLYGMVCIINGATIIQGTDTAIASIKEAGTAISTCLLPNGNIFIAHSDNSASNIRLNGIVVTISGTTITPGSDTILVNGTNAGSTISTCLLPNGNVFIAHSYSGNSGTYYLYGMVVSINGTTITPGTHTSLVATKYAGYAISTCLLPNGNVFIAHSYGSNYYLYGIVCSISGTTVGKGNDTVITDSSNVGRAISACTLENGNVFIAHSYESNYYLYGIICSISETTIVKGTDTALEAGGYEAAKVLTMVLKEDKVFVTKCHLADASRLWASICTINNTSITIGTTVRLSDARGSGNVMSSVLLNNGTIFVAHNHTDGTNYLYAQIFDVDETNNIPTKHIIAIGYETQIRKITTGRFDGVAKTSGEGASGYTEQEVAKTGNAFPTSGWIEEVANTKYSTNDGWIIESNNTMISPPSNVKNAFDNSTSTYWSSINGSGTQHYITLTCPQPIKIIKMSTYYISGNSESDFLSMQILGKKNDGNWVTLYTQSTYYTNTLENILSNVDFYNQYRILINTKGTWGATVGDWQTTEYVVKELVPSTEHNEQVSIYQPSCCFNLIPDSSFEGDIWTARNDAGGIQITDKVSYNGNRSLYFPVGQTIVPEIPIARPILGHKYYGRRYIKTNGDNQPADCRFEMYGGDGEGKNWVFAWNNGNHPNWDFDSAIHEVTAINYPETTQTVLRCFNVNTTAETWVDDLLLLDLTDLFGTGKEPTKEWCDNNL